MATYYIDYASGNDGNDGLSTGQAWKTLTHADGQSFSAGDVIKMRANQTHSYSETIYFTDDGTFDNYNTIKGCDSLDDPWGDGSDVRPILDFNSGNYNLRCDRYWRLEHIEAINSTKQYGALVTNYWGLIIDCVVRNNSYGLTAEQIEDCIIYNNTRGIYRGRKTIIKNCQIYGNTVGYSCRGIGYVEVYDTTFGTPTPNSTADIQYIYGSNCGRLYGRNVLLNSSTEVSIVSGNNPRLFASVEIEEYQQLKGQHKAWYNQGTITISYAMMRPGVATPTAEVSPLSACEALWPLQMFERAIYLPASQVTLTVYMQATGWSGLPSNSECYIEIDYYAGATAQRTKVQSSEAFALADTWTAYTVTVTPNSAGAAYLRGFLSLYDASGKVYVDIEPVLS